MMEWSGTKSHPPTTFPSFPCSHQSLRVPLEHCSLLLSLYLPPPCLSISRERERGRCCIDMSHASYKGAEEEVEERRGGGMGEEVMYVRVMTDEQLEVLRRQIAVYATICEQLVEMHKAITAHHDSLAGLRLGSLYCDSLMTPKITARQRWTPTSVQLQVLESIFDQGNGAPSKARIKEIAQELSQHGPISESNVYNWFQNRRARSKRKQQSAVPSNSESEVEADVESPNKKKAKQERIQPHEKLPAKVDELSFRRTDTSPEVSSINQETKRTQGMYGNLSQLSFYENALSNPRTNHLMGKLEFPGSFSSLWPGESYHMMG